MLSQKVFTGAVSSVLCLSAGAAAAAPADDLVCKDAAAQGKIVAAASFNAMAEFTRAVAAKRSAAAGVRWAEIMSVWKR